MAFREGGAEFHQYERREGAFQFTRPGDAFGFSVNASNESPVYNPVQAFFNRPGADGTCKLLVGMELEAAKPVDDRDRPLDPNGRASMKRLAIALLLLMSSNAPALARGVREYVDTTCRDGDFKLSWDGAAADVYVCDAENLAVRTAASLFCEDVERVTGVKPALKNKTAGLSRHAVIVGTPGACPVIDKLVEAGKVDVREVKGQWETFLIQVVPNPMRGVEKGLVVVGSDRRGAIYGLFDISENLGVSPWHWFADVHPMKQKALVVRKGAYRQGPPSVKYRGVFINDEMWGIRPWAQKTHAPDEGQGLGPKTYRRIFELLLRLKANHIWPAMHRGTKPFNYYERNKVVADEYAIVMGSSHIEPMLRNNIGGAEWDTEYPGEPWNYLTNREHIYKYWEDRVKTNAKYENVYTIGKRGKDDAAGRDVTVPVLERIFADQRKILRDWVDPDPTKVPQVLIAYTEVLGLLNQGLKVPDDAIICWPDDNWGHIRQLPNAAQRRRRGGSGVYYHFQWLQGASGCYVWLHTTPPGLIWQQMHMAHEHGARDLWVANVGDIKPAEIATEFFLRMAWDIEPWGPDSSGKFLRSWASREFGPTFAEPIAEIMEEHFELGYARRPESMVQKGGRGPMRWQWFSLDHYGDEAQRRIDAYDELIRKTDRIYARLPRDLKDAFFQTVLYNVKGAGLHNLKVLHAQKSHAYGQQGRTSAAGHARKARKALEDLKAVIEHYNTSMVTVGDKWNHMASMPGPYGGMKFQFDMPPLSDFAGKGPARLNLALEGGDELVLPDVSVYDRRKRFIDLYNSGTGTIAWTASATEDWVRLSERSGKFDTETRIRVDVDWDKAPKGRPRADIAFQAAGRTLRAVIWAFNPASPARDEVVGFVESGGCVSMEAEHYSRKIDRGGAGWRVIGGLGRTGDSVTVLPSAIKPRTGDEIATHSPVLEYDVHLFSKGEVTVRLYSSPTRPIHAGYGLRYAVSFDDGAPAEVTGGSASVIDNVRKMAKRLSVARPGRHVLKVWMVDPGMVLDKIVIDTGGAANSYLGPPESFRGRAPKVRGR